MVTSMTLAHATCSGSAVTAIAKTTEMPIIPATFNAQRRGASVCVRTRRSSHQRDHRAKPGLRRSGGVVPVASDCDEDDAERRTAAASCDQAGQGGVAADRTCVGVVGLPIGGQPGQQNRDAAGYRQHPEGGHRHCGTNGADGDGQTTGATVLTATSVENTAIAARGDDPSPVQCSISSDMVAAATAARNTFAAPGPDGTARNPAAAASGTDARPVAALRPTMANPAAVHVPIAATSRWVVVRAAAPQHSASEPTTAAQNRRPRIPDRTDLGRQACSGDRLAWIPLQQPERRRWTAAILRTSPS